MLNIQSSNTQNNSNKAVFYKKSVKSSLGKFQTTKLEKDSFEPAQKSAKNPSFGTLFRITESGRKIDTAFFRGKATMKAAANLLNKMNEKISVLHYGGSIAEEAYTNRILLKNPNIKVVSLDIDPEAVALAKKGVHSIITGFGDSFLIRPDSLLTEEEIGFKAAFAKMFSPTQRPDFVLNNKFENEVIKPIRPSDEHFFKMNEEARALVEIREAQDGSIFEHNSPRGEKVGAIYARNFLNQLTGNNINNVIIGNEKPVKPNTKILQKFADSVYAKLEDNGFLVVGDFIGEHFFLAHTPKVDNIKMSKTELYRGMNFSSQLEVADYEISEVSPLRVALEKDNKFKAIFFDSLDCFPYVKVPTIWQKIPQNQ